MQAWVYGVNDGSFRFKAVADIDVIEKVAIGFDER
jgi:hypothetical protein